MTESRLVKWLEEQKTVARKNAEEQYNAAVQEYKDKLDMLMGIDEIAKQVSQLASKADDILNAWVEKITQIEGIKFELGYRGAKWYLMDISSVSNVKSAMRKDYCDNSDELNQLNKKKRLIDSEIIANYDNVIANIRCLKDAKAGASYLQELGFDLSKLMEEEDNPITALSIPVDKTYLFVQVV